MNTAVTENKTFEQKMADRIKDQIGDLIGAEDLQKLVAEGIKKAFFEEIKTYDRYGSLAGTKGPFITDVVKELLTEQVKEAVSKHFVDHAAEINVLIKELVEKGMAGILMGAINAKFQGDLYAFGNMVQQNIMNSMHR